MIWPEEHRTLSATQRARVLDAARPSLSALLAREQTAESAAWLALAELHVYLAAAIAARFTQQGRTLVVGIAGAQGSGKTTVTGWLACLLEHGFGLRTARYSLDDFYLTATQRARLARDHHPLLATRGVPGTHDVDLAMSCLYALRTAREGEQVEVPMFSKAHDNRAPRDQWHVVSGPVDVILFEGWCVGAAAEAEPALRAPINALERDRDSDGRFRRYVNQQLTGPYARWFAEIDMLVMLRAPGFEFVREWRVEQEKKLAVLHPGEAAVMSEAQVADFIGHYERITRHMLQELPRRADIVLELAPDRRIQSVSVAATIGK